MGRDGLVERSVRPCEHRAVRQLGQPVVDRDVKPQAATKELPVNYAAQLTGYWCGPAATRIAMSAKTGDLPSQAELAKELRTTENGTDHVGQVADGLNKLLAPTGAHYVAKDLSERQQSPEMSNELWNDTVRNIDEGKAMGLAAYGKPKHLDLVREHIMMGEHGVRINNKAIWDACATHLQGHTAFQQRADIAANLSSASASQRKLISLTA